MTTLQEVNSAIISGQFSNTDLDSIYNALKFARSQLVHKNTGSLVIGSQVRFTSTRDNKIVLGTVKKVNRKFILVSENGKSHLTWRVPANMLEAA